VGIKVILEMQAVAQAAVQAMVSCLILGMGIAGVAWVLTRALPPGKAGLRFTVWFSALGAIALLPLMHRLLLSRAGAHAESLARAHGWMVLAPDWTVYLFWPWVLVASAGLVRVIGSVYHLHRLAATSTAVEPAELDAGVLQTVLRAAQARAFDVRVSDRIRVPVAIGLFRPAVVLPRYLLQELSPRQLNQVLLHETTHLLRYDDWTNLLQKIANALLFFHPAVWWLENRLTLEREMACDEAVVAETADPRSYAECLALLAEKSVTARGLALVQAAVSRLRHTSLRVKELLHTDRAKTGRVWGAAAGVLGVLACSALSLQAPDLISFQSRNLGRTENHHPDFALRAPLGWGTSGVPVGKLDTMTGVTPQIVPASFTQKVAPGRRLNVKPEARILAAAQPTGEAPTGKAKVALAMRGEERSYLVPVSLTTVVLVEDSGSAQVSTPASQNRACRGPHWTVWHITVFYSTFYPTADQSARTPRKT